MSKRTKFGGTHKTVYEVGVPKKSEYRYKKLVSVTLWIREVLKNIYEGAEITEQK